MTFAFSVAATGERAEPLDAGTESAPALKAGLTPGDLGFVKKVTTVAQAMTKMEELGVKNVKAHRKGNTSAVVTGDTLPFILVFGPKGYETTVSFSDALAEWARPENYAAKILRNGKIIVTAEDLEFILPSGEPGLGVFLVTLEPKDHINTFRIDITEAAETYGGFIEPEILEKPDKNQVILHAKDANGTDWPKAYILDAATGRLNGVMDWEKETER